MAQKKQSQAEKAVTAKNAKTNKSQTATRKKSSPRDDGKKQIKEKRTEVPVRLITSIISLCCFILFLIAFLNPEGMLVQFFEVLVLSMIGQIGFYVAIPALLYLFVIQAFSGKRPVILRSVILFPQPEAPRIPILDASPS